MFDFQQINVWGTLAAGLAAYALGPLWFSPVLFGKRWGDSVRASSLLPGSPALAMGTTLATTLAAAFAMALLFQVGGIDSTGRGLVAGALVGLGIVATSSLSDALFVGQVRLWWAIQAGYRIVAFLLLGAILGASAPENRFRALERQMNDTGAQLQEQVDALGKALGSD
jgi:hypothetical protein